jgi:hypothetical protein
LKKEGEIARKKNGTKKEGSTNRIGVENSKIKEIK